MSNAYETVASTDPAGHLSGGLGDHGYVYLESGCYTGATLVPHLPRIHGSTGTVGNPVWEALDGEKTYRVFLSYLLSQSFHANAPSIYSSTRWPDRVLFLPPTERLRAVETPAIVQQELQDVLVELRATAGLPVGDLAAMLGVSRRQFYNWLDHTNTPDVEQERRVRYTAEAVGLLAKDLDDPRAVRTALLTQTEYGSAFAAFRDHQLELARRIVDLIRGTATHGPSSDPLYDREAILLELQHLRHVPLRGDE